MKLILFITLIILLGCNRSQSSSTFSRTVSFNAIDMAAHGNCLPFDISGLQISDSYFLSDSSVTSQCFISPNKIVASVEGGKIYICNLEMHETRLLAELEYKWVFVGPARENDFLVISNTYYNDEYPEGVRDIFCFTTDGHPTWNVKEFGGLPPIIYDGYYVSALRDLEGNEQLCHIDELGVTIINSYLNSDTGLFALYPTDMGLIWTGYNHGPFLTRELDNEYFTMEQWLPNWDFGVFPIALASENKLVGFNVASSELIILDRTDRQATVVEYLAELGIQERVLPDDFGLNLLASTPDTSVILYGSHLIKYQDSYLEFWHEDLKQYSSNYSPISLYIGKSATSFIICMDYGILVSYGDTVNEIKFGHGDANRWEFSEGYKKAVFGTSDGMLYIISLNSCE